MESRNAKLRALCAPLEAAIEARLAGKLEEYRELEKRWAKVGPETRQRRSDLALAMQKKKKTMDDVLKIRELQADLAKMSDEYMEVEAKLASLRLYVYHARMIELNGLREKVAAEAAAAAREGYACQRSYAKPKRPSWKPVEHHVKSLEELEALLLTPHIRQPETLERLQEIIRIYQELDLGAIVVRICDTRPGKPGVVWEYEREKKCSTNCSAN